MPQRRIRVLLTAAAIALTAPSLGAQDVLDRAVLHGYGGWGFGRTTANDNLNFFNYAHQRGDYSHSEFALNIAVPVNERLTVVAQPFWHQGHHANQTASGLDFGFGEWRYSDLARFRAGLVKQPFGVYTEIFDVGTLRPFANLPSSIYGPSGTVGKAYSGIGFTGEYYTAAGWGLQYDAYAGGLEVTEWDAGLQVLAEGADTVGRTLNLGLTKTYRDVVGGRLNFQTPVTGLTVGVSGYTGTRPGTGVEIRRSAGAAHLEFLTDRVSLRSEIARNKETTGLVRESTGGYAEAAYRITSHWQVAALYDNSDSELPNVSAANIARADNLLRHEEQAVGLNYWFTQNFVLKTSFHSVEGNRFAAPDQARIRSAVARNTLAERTRVVFFGAQLSF